MTGKSNSFFFPDSWTEQAIIEYKVIYSRLVPEGMVQSVRFGVHCTKLSELMLLSYFGNIYVF